MQTIGTLMAVVLGGIRILTAAVNVKVLFTFAI
jgi:hypothetical protein